MSKLDINKLTTTTTKSINKTVLPLTDLLPNKSNLQTSLLVTINDEREISKNTPHSMQDISILAILLKYFRYIERQTHRWTDIQQYTCTYTHIHAGTEPTNEIWSS